MISSTVAGANSETNSAVFDGLIEGGEAEEQQGTEDLRLVILAEKWCTANCSGKECTDCEG